MRDHGRLGPIEWATAGRPIPGEGVSGDHPIAMGIGGDGALFGVIDGLGHGVPAATAARRAIAALEHARTGPLDDWIQVCHRALAGTRGVTMTLALVDFGACTLTWTGVGNVTANLVAKDSTGTHIRSCARLAAGIVGDRIPELSPAQVIPLRIGDLLVIATDGITEDHLEHLDLAATAVAIADDILGKHAKDTDDAMVLTARHRGAPL